jgi:dTDP-4-dehydrorhamnose 3,5-epimerase
MEFTETYLKGAYVVKLKRIEDSRGYFARAWCVDEFAVHGLNSRMLQLNVGFSRTKGTLRGMHFQAAPHEEAKFIRCTRGAIYDVIVDLRPGSITYGKWFGVELTAEGSTMLYAPEGFAHGYQTLQDDTEIYYMTSARYAAASAKGVRYNDPALAIDWPSPVSVISDQDRTWPDIQP